MLLIDLLKLFENDFNIKEERLIAIVESNNIRLNQRLLSEIKVEKNLTTKTSKTNITTNVNITSNNEDDNYEILSKQETNVRGCGRGRGRPRKIQEVKEEETVLVEVEIVQLGTTEYYKTKENVILNKDLEIEGILKDGKLLRRE
jgi:hypothetical protein